MHVQIFINSMLVRCGCFIFVIVIGSSLLLYLKVFEDVVVGGRFMIAVMSLVKSFSFKNGYLVEYLLKHCYY